MAKLFVNGNRKGAKINRNIYGHFAEHLGRCIYGGLYVGNDKDIPNTNGMRNDVVQALRNIQIPVLRWPGGCFADEYHWKDGVGPKAARRKMVNTHWGGVIEDNSFGTHEFMELCRQLGCEPYICGNVGSGSMQEMSEWVEYMTFDGVSPMAELRAANGQKEPWKLKYFGVGNENWGCGGQMTPEHYADLYRRYQTYVRSYGENKLYKIACGPARGHMRWTKVLMEQAADKMDALGLHYYTIPYAGKSKRMREVPFADKSKRGSALHFSSADYYNALTNALYMGELVENHSRIMDYYDPAGRVGLIVDEWGTWFDTEPGTNPRFLYQQNTMRDAIVAAIHFNIFNRHARRVVMANIAQTVNVLQAVVLTEGNRMLLTPTYHVFDLYKGHHDATLLESYVESEMVGEGEDMVPSLDVSASVDEKGLTHVTLANLSVDKAYPVQASFAGVGAKLESARILQGAMNAHNTFDAPEQVRIESFEAIKQVGDELAFTMPACSVLEITLR